MDKQSNQQAMQQSGQTKPRTLMESLGVYALVRTALSSERSLMAWMRVSAGMYSFGFTVSRFLDYLEKQKDIAKPSTGLHRLGLILSCIGIIGLILAAAGHFQRLRKMKKLGLPTISIVSLPMCATVALLVIGIAVLISIVSI